MVPRAEVATPRTPGPWAQLFGKGEHPILEQPVSKLDGVHVVLGGRAEAGEPVGGEEAGVWGQALHKPGEGRGAREGERAPRPCAIRPQPRGPGSVTETQLPRTCISALTQPGPRKSSLTPTTPLGPRSALLLTLLILSPNISGSGCSLPPSPPTHSEGQPSGCPAAQSCLARLRPLGPPACASHVARGSFPQASLRGPGRWCFH